ncbi:AI-2E family transporter [Catenulispora yoronensis]|uniref:AI-2E family transporter n=1 Tax=Catenulispora yoronensis TaxID=450799 RepID=A0ABN2TYZ0_9ACTN
MSDAPDPAPDPAPSPSRWPLPAWAVRATAWNLAVIVAVAVLAGLIWMLVKLSAAVIPLLMALLATSLLEPLTRRLTDRIHNRSAAAGLACGVLVAVVGGTVFLVVRAVVDASAGIGRALDRVGQRLGVGSVDDAVSSAAEALKSMGSKTASALAAGVVQGVSTAAQVLTGSVLAVALIFFLLRDGRLFPSLVAGTLPEAPARAAIRMAERAWSALSGFMRGTTIIALIDAVLILVGLLILRVPGATGLAALVFVGAYVPYIGAFLSGTVAVFVALGDQGVGTAIWTLGVILGVQVIEGNFLQPIVQSRTVSLHPAVVMFAVTGGTAIGGIIGALLAVPLTAAAFGMAAEWRVLTRPPEPPDQPGQPDQPAQPGQPGQPGQPDQDPPAVLQ